MEDAVRSLFKLDKDEGYAIQLVVWPNYAPQMDDPVWDQDHMLQSDDFDDDKKLHRTVKKLTRFLDQYKKVPLNAGVAKESVRLKSSTIEAELKEIKESRARLQAAMDVIAKEKVEEAKLETSQDLMALWKKYNK